MKNQKDRNQPVKTYTLAQITAAVSFTFAFIAALGQFVVIFLPDVFSKWVLTAALSTAVVGVIVGLVASNQANREQVAQMERERQVRELALREESQVREEAIRNESHSRELAILSESQAREAGLVNEKWARRITVWTVAGGLVLGTLMYLVAMIKISSTLGKGYGERMMREIWESKK
jgi:hypothetical protein